MANDTPQDDPLALALRELVARWRTASLRLAEVSLEDSNSITDQLKVVVDAAIDTAVARDAAVADRAEQELRRLRGELELSVEASTGRGWYAKLTGNSLVVSFALLVIAITALLYLFASMGGSVGGVGYAIGVLLFILGSLAGRLGR